MRFSPNARPVIAWVAVLSLFALGMSEAAEAPAKPKGRRLGSFGAQDEQPVTAELIAKHASVQPGGRTQVGVLFEIERGWHIYAKDSGDAGLPTSIKWAGPPGAHFGDLAWPPHQEFQDPGDIHTFGYAGSVVLSSSLSLDPGYADAVAPVSAHVEWLACHEICLPGSADLELKLPVGPEPPRSSTHAQHFEQVAE